MQNSIVCVDASTVVRLVVGGEHFDLIADRWIALRDSGIAFAAPGLLRYEVCNAILRYSAASILTQDEAFQALDRVLNLRIALYNESAIHNRALSIATDLGMSAAYDAHYLALAEILRAPLLTIDRKLAARVAGTAFEVELIGG